MRTVRPITREDLEPLLLAAAKDKHEVWFPTHVVEAPDGTLVGYACVSMQPAVVFVWMDSQRNTARDTVTALKSLDDFMRMSGVQGYLMPCAPGSPYFAHMERLGFVPKGQAEWFQKNLYAPGGGGVPRPACAGHSPSLPGAPTE